LGRSAADPHGEEERITNKTIRPVETEEALSGLRDAWDALLERPSGANPFLTYEWISSWWKNFGGKRRLFVLAAFDETGSRMKGIAPFMITRSAGFKVLQFIGTGLSDRLQILLEAGADAVIDELFVLLANRRDVWDIMILRDVPENDPAVACLARLAAQRGWRIRKKRTSVAPYLPVKGSWEEFLATKSSHFRRVRRQKEERLSRPGIDFQVRRIRGPVDDAAITDFETILSRSWKGREPVTAKQGARMGRFYAGFLRAFGKKGWLDLWLGYFDSRPAAYQILFDYKGTVSFYNNAFAKQFERYGIGSVLMARAIEEAFRLGRTECDFLRGDERFKSQWTAEKRYLEDVVLVRNTPRSCAAYAAAVLVERNMERGARYLAHLYRKRTSEPLARAWSPPETGSPGGRGGS